MHKRWDRFRFKVKWIRKKKYHLFVVVADAVSTQSCMCFKKIDRNTASKSTQLINKIQIVLLFSGLFSSSIGSSIIFSLVFGINFAIVFFFFFELLFRFSFFSSQNWIFRVFFSFCLATIAKSMTRNKGNKNKAKLDGWYVVCLFWIHTL